MNNWLQRPSVLELRWSTSAEWKGFRRQQFVVSLASDEDESRLSHTLNQLTELSRKPSWRHLLVYLITDGRVFTDLFDSILLFYTLFSLAFLHLHRVALMHGLVSVNPWNGRSSVFTLMCYLGYYVVNWSSALLLLLSPNPPAQHVCPVHVLHSEVFVLCGESWTTAWKSYTTSRVCVCVCFS